MSERKFIGGNYSAIITENDFLLNLIANAIKRGGCNTDHNGKFADTKITFTFDALKQFVKEVKNES